MITLYGFGPVLGMPDPSAFVVKVEVLLKMAGLPYHKDNSGALSKAPKGKLPFIDDDGTKVADSTFIRLYLEQKYQADFDLNMAPEQKAIAFLVEKYCEESLYFILARDRWIHEENFNRGPRRFFNRAPALIRPFIIKMIRGKIRKTLWAQGMGRHTEAELLVLFNKGIEAIAILLGDKPYLGGVQPCGADATLFAFLMGFLSPTFVSVFGDAVRAHSHLVAYHDRMLAAFYPNFVAGSAENAQAA